MFSIQNDSVYSMAGAFGAAREVVFCAFWTPRYLEAVEFPPLIPPLPAMCTHTQKDTDSILLIR